MSLPKKFFVVFRETLTSPWVPFRAKFLVAPNLFPGLGYTAGLVCSCIYLVGAGSGLSSLKRTLVWIFSYFHLSSPTNRSQPVDE